ncbi:MAG TPA: UdgX family uracil-DNA binding protein [Aliidongia sp.]|uniref:UdgX family uracil-DNA binding protein n=1 Tax=Aliidongia sp. TaxID=1914230 RepID=UPI002DDDBC4C|nr:UdgX family uracil-DNA binding protein [Aliidongia sp.]HEV2677210.1 UdgX family uracil-DNA binding protein [Aliidongia sp.]
MALAGEIDFDGWRRAARQLLGRGVPPGEIFWSTAAEDDLFGAGNLVPPGGESPSFTVPRAFVSLAETALLHRDPERFAHLYRLLWRLRDEPRLLEVAIDPDVAQVQGMAKSVRRDIHKMRAFVRFRRTKLDEADWYVAWFEPEHHILEANAPFFMRRFTAMNWSILTPEASAHWDGADLAIGPGARKADAPGDDALEDLWRGYYASIFNPARLKIGAMHAEMPVKYWRNLPEASLIHPLIEHAQRRMNEMVTDGPTAPNARPHHPHRAAEPPKAEAGSLGALRAEAAGCRACPLWEPATQTVFGEGPPDAPVLFVGEQPGDQEDLEGHPFVGPAGRLFDRALAEAGVDRTHAYVTNAVKHFKFELRGKRRIHQKPGGSEIKACRFWLDREIDLVQPRLIVALGATAAQSLFGKAMPVGKSRGRLLDAGQGRTQALITVHPSYLLRLPDEAAKAEEYGRFVEDLRLTRGFFEAA